MVDDHYALEEKQWKALSLEHKEKVFKYLKLLKRFSKSPDLISNYHKKWLLQNAAAPTYLMPLEDVQEHLL